MFEFPFTKTYYQSITLVGSEDKRLDIYYRNEKIHSINMDEKLGEISDDYSFDNPIEAPVSTDYIEDFFVLVTANEEDFKVYIDKYLIVAKVDEMIFRRKDNLGNYELEINDETFFRSCRYKQSKMGLQL